ncbi:hypothetical protein Tco_0452832 [Tanacetum coccineum]
MDTAYPTSWIRHIEHLRYGVLGSLGTTYWLFGYGELAENVLLMVFDQSIIYGVYTNVDTTYSSKSGNDLLIRQAIYRIEVCTEVCAGAIYPNKVVSEPDQRLSISEEALGAFGKSQTYSAEDRYMGRGYDRGQEAEQKQVEIMKDRRDKCKEELERFKLRSGKVRLADDNTLDIAGVGDVVLKTSFDISWTLKDVSLVVARGNKRESLHTVEVHPEGIGTIIDDGSGSAALWFGEAEEAFLNNVRVDKETAETVMLKMVLETPLQFGVAERLSRTFSAESTGLRVEAPKMLRVDSVSTTYLIYRIPYVLIGLRIPEEEWRGKDTSLAHLKVVAQMKCDTAFKIQRVTRLSEAEILHLWSQFMEPENDSIVAEHGLSSEITQSPGGSSDTSGGLRDSTLAKNPYSGKRHHKDCGCSRSKKRSEKALTWQFPLVFEMKDRCYEKQVLGYVLTVGVTIVEWESRLQKSITMLSVNYRSLVYGSRISEQKVDMNLKVCSWAKLVRILISEGSLSLLKILGTKCLAEMFTRLVMKEKLKFYAASTSL